MAARNNGQSTHGDRPRAMPGIDRPADDDPLVDERAVIYVRIDAQIHRALVSQAHRAQCSLNQLCGRILREFLAGDRELGTDTTAARTEPCSGSNPTS